MQCDLPGRQIPGQDGEGHLPAGQQDRGHGYDCGQGGHDRCSRQVAAGGQVCRSGQTEYCHRKDPGPRYPEWSTLRGHRAPFLPWRPVFYIT